VAVDADRAIDFISNLRNTKGKFAGSPFHVYDFQEELIRRLCAKNRRGRRKVNEALYGVARKNGKTELIAALALVFLVLDEEPGGEVVVAAGKRDQARLLFSAASKMVRTSTVYGRPLSDFLTVRRDAIYFPELDARLYPVSADAQNEQGLNPHVAIVDELHVAAEKNRDLYDALQTATGAREDPLVLSLTTAGPVPSGPCYDLYKYGLEVAGGTRTDPNFAMIWHEAPPDLEVDDPAAWAAANPALDRFLFRENIERDAKAVKDGRAPEYVFRRLRLNQWTTAVERWLPHLRWKACETPPSIPDDAPLYVGIDAAISRDTFGISWVWVEEAVEVNGAQTSVAHVRVKKFEAAREGDYIDPADVEMFILGLASRHPLLEVAYDPAYMGLLASALADRGVPMVPFPQSADRMTKATETLQRLVLDQRIRHGADPDLDSQMAGVGTSITERGVRISKRRSGLKIDCVVALAMALDRALGEEDPGQDFALVID
jgi:phage terminase large subunit-like protein